MRVMRAARAAVSALLCAGALYLLVAYRTLRASDHAKQRASGERRCAAGNRSALARCLLLAPSPDIGDGERIWRELARDEPADDGEYADVEYDDDDDDTELYSYQQDRFGRGRPLHKVSALELIRRGFLAAQLAADGFGDDDYYVEASQVEDAPVRYRGAARNNLILLWSHPWYVNSAGPREGAKFGKCTVTYQRAYLRHARAVVFQYIVAADVTSWNHYRHPDQLFVWWSMENPWVVRYFGNLGVDTTRFDTGFYNVTMTYRRDSDIYFPYYLKKDLIEKLPRGRRVVDDIIRRKKATAIWIVSDCGMKKGAQWRYDFMLDLREAGLEIDLFGSCFDNANLIPKSDPRAQSDLISHYRFYLSFENALHCRDYVTEKLFENSLANGAVPVVWGPSKTDVAAVAPIGSFIHAEDFASAADLARYLQKLSRDERSYRSYFRWREDARSASHAADTRAVESRYPGVNVPPQVGGWERLCERARDRDRRRSTVGSVSAFLDDDSAECLSQY